MARTAPGVAACVVALLLSACAQPGNTPTSGTLTVAASDAPLALVRAAAAAFEARYPDAHIRVLKLDGFRATEALLRGSAGMAVLPREPVADETRAAERFGQALHWAPVAVEGIAVVVHPVNALAEIREADVERLVRGETRLWRDIGGGPDSVEVFAPDPSTGTGGYLTRLREKGAQNEVPLYYQASDSAVVAQVAIRPRALGFVSAGYLLLSSGARPGIHVLDVRPTVESSAPVSLSQSSLAENTYPLTSTITAVTRGEPDRLAAGFIAFITSQRGQRTLERAGFAPVAPSSFEVHLH